MPVYRVKVDALTAAWLADPTGFHQPACDGVPQPQDLGDGVVQLEQVTLDYMTEMTEELEPGEDGYFEYDGEAIRLWVDGIAYDVVRVGDG
jgi:hypothetical protein